MVNIILSSQKFDEEKFQSFCERYNLIFPESYMKYIKKYNDSEMDSNIVAGAENSGIYVRYFYGTTHDDFSNITEVYKTYINRMPQKCIPIADADFGNQICMSLHSDTYGTIFFWDHETMDTDYNEECKLEYKDMLLLADTFDEFLDKIIPFETDSSITPEKEASFFNRIKKMLKR